MIEILDLDPGVGVYLNFMFDNVSMYIFPLLLFIGEGVNIYF